MRPLSLLLIIWIAINSSSGDTKKYLRSRWNALNAIFGNPRHMENARKPGQLDFTEHEHDEHNSGEGLRQINGTLSYYKPGQVEKLWNDDKEATKRITSLLGPILEKPKLAVLKKVIFGPIGAAWQIPFFYTACGLGAKFGAKIFKKLFILFPPFKIVIPPAAVKLVLIGFCPPKSLIATAIYQKVLKKALKKVLKIYLKTFPKDLKFEVLEVLEVLAPLAVAPLKAPLAAKPLVKVPLAVGPLAAAPLATAPLVAAPLALAAPLAIGGATLGTGALAAGTLGAGTLAAGTLGAGTLAAGTLGAGTLAAGTLGAGTLGAGTLAVGTLGAGTLAAGTLGAGTLGAGTLGAGTLGAATLGAGTIGAATLGTGVVGAGTIGAGTLGAATLGAGTLGAGTIGAATLGAGALGAGTLGAATLGAGTLGAATLGAGALGAGTLGLGAATLGTAAVGATTIPFALEQITGIQDFLPCTGASIESCAKIDLDFDTFVRNDRLNIFGKTLEKRLDTELDDNTKFFEATDFSYLVVVKNPDLECDSIHGTFKITGVGSFAIENCGDCNCHLVIKKIDDNALHSTYDESGLVTDDSQLPIKIQNLLQKGKEDLTTTVTVSVIIYFTEAFQMVTPDIKGHVENVIAHANIAFLKSGVPVKLSMKCMLKTDLTEAPDSTDRIREFRDIQGNEERLMQSADMAVLITNSTANGGIGGQVDGVDPMRNPGKLRVAWMSKNYNGAFIHELGHLFGARHDRDGDLGKFENVPNHGYFINPERQNLSYTIMATGDDIELEDGRLDGGLGRIFYFSAPRQQYGITLGDRENDNARLITTSRFAYASYGDESKAECTNSREISVLLYPTTLITRFIPAYFT